MEVSSPREPFGRPLRVALFLDSFLRPRWVERVVRDIQTSGVASIVVVVRNEATAPPRTFWQKLVEKGPHLVRLLYERLDDRLFGRAGDPFRSVDLTPLLAGCAVEPVTPRMTKFCDYFPDEAIDRLVAYDVDVGVRFGFRILKGRALTIAPHGVWSYHHGDNLVNRGGPPGFWETFEAHPATGSVLQVLTEELDGGLVIYRSHAATDTRSVRRNKANYYAKSSAFLIRKLRELHAEGPGALRDPFPPAEGWMGYSERLYVAPTNLEMVALLWRLGTRYLKEKLRELVTIDQWVMLYRLSPRAAKGAPGCLPAVGGVPDQTMYRLVPIIPPKDRFWADPFPVYRDGRHYLFFEEYPYATARAHISMMELGPDGRWGPVVEVLRRPYHLSYPFMFEWQGEWYMLPETGANRTVELYRATSFPHGWELDRVLLSGLHAVDATLAEIGGRWWMFVNVAEEGAFTWDELHLYHAPSPLGPWTPHRRNPVKSDVRNARPAGRPFQQDGVWYRPAQDCSVRYGYALVVNRIDRLDEEEYRETPVSKLLPNWLPDMMGTHTINAAGGLTVVDAWIQRPRFR